MAELAAPRRAMRVRGNLFRTPGALAHQVNVLSVDFIEFWNLHVFDIFPSAELPFDLCVPGTCVTVPVHHPRYATTHVCNLFAHLPPRNCDDADARIALLDRALEQLALHAIVYEFAQINFPRGIGCGDWRVYKARIHALAARVPCPVAIVKSPFSQLSPYPASGNAGPE